MGSDGYRLCSRFYDRTLEPINAPLRWVAHRMCPPQPGWTVLDIGCGTGAASPVGTGGSMMTERVSVAPGFP